jgi:hypothetical protein
MVGCSLFVVSGARDWSHGVIARLAETMRAVSNGSRDLLCTGA